MKDEGTCILCYGTDLSQTGTVPTQQIVRSWKQKFGIDIIDEFKGINELHLLQCGICGLAFFSPVVTGSEQVYSALQQFDWYYLDSKWEFNRALRDLQSNSCILEIGCGEGAFLEQAKAKGFRAQGIELNDQAVQSAIEKGLSVGQIDLFDLVENAPEKYDAVCFFQVLEHISNPRSFLVAGLRLLKPGGRLILSVPNNAGFIQYDHDDLLNRPPHHISRWSPDVFTYLSRILPVQLLSLSWEPLAMYHLDWYIAVQQSRLSSQTRSGRLAQLALESWVRYILKPTKLISFFKGHTIYACYEKKATV
jgi:SAM-dependent methyltransferase